MKYKYKYKQEQKYNYNSSTNTNKDKYQILRAGASQGERGRQIQWNTNRNINKYKVNSNRNTNKGKNQILRAGASRGERGLGRYNEFNKNTNISTSTNTFTNTNRNINENTNTDVGKNLKHQFWEGSERATFKHRHSYFHASKALENRIHRCICLLYIKHKGLLSPINSTQSVSIGVKNLCLSFVHFSLINQLFTAINKICQI